MGDETNAHLTLMNIFIREHATNIAESISAMFKGDAPVVCDIASKIIDSMSDLTYLYEGRTGGILPA
jgi:hypothetical protein